MNWFIDILANKLEILHVAVISNEHDIKRYVSNTLACLNNRVLLYLAISLTGGQIYIPLP